MSLIDFNQLNGKKGISVLYAVFIMIILLGIGFGLSGLSVQQMKLLGDIGHSTIAFYAADSCIESVLMNQSEPSNISLVLANGSTCQVSVSFGGSCTAPNFCIKSIGSYQEAKRAIEINY